MALHILALHASKPSEVLTSGFIASSVNTHPVVIRRLLGQLRKARLVSIQPGPGGGSRLARSPKTLHLREIYRAVENGTLLSLHRSRPNSLCPVGRHIESVIGNVLADAEQAFEGALGKLTLEDLVKALQTSEARSRHA